MRGHSVIATRGEPTRARHAGCTYRLLPFISREPCNPNGARAAQSLAHSQRGGYGLGNPDLALHNFPRMALRVGCRRWRGPRSNMLLRDASLRASNRIDEIDHVVRSGDGGQRRTDSWIDVRAPNVICRGVHRGKP